MARWKNFNIWRGRLPHWRAEDVTYFATFRHRRELQDEERQHLFKALLMTHGKKFDIEAVIVGPESTEIIFRVASNAKGEPYELSDVIERAKSKAGAQIIKRSGERFPPFFGECYDRIIRDDAEFSERLEAILTQADVESGGESPDNYAYLFISSPNQGL